MKLFSLILAAVLSAAVLTPAPAEASPRGGHSTRVTYDHTGCRIVWAYTCVGHDYHGRPIFRWVIQSRSYGHGGSHHGHGGYRGGHGHGGHGHYDSHRGHGGHGRGGHGHGHGGHGHGHGGHGHRHGR